MTNKNSFIVFGTGGEFTYNVIQTLVKENYKPLAYIQSGNIQSGNIQSGNTPLQQATFQNIELEILKPQSALNKLLNSQNISVHYQTPTKLDQFIQRLNVEYLLVACWPQLIPDKVLQSVSNAALNLHPSLLPNFRGIDPVADQLKNNDNNFGISLHLISDSYDTGDIVLQQTLDEKIKLDKSDIETKAAIKGAKLFIQAINTYHKPGWKLVKQYTT